VAQFDNEGFMRPFIWLAFLIAVLALCVLRFG